MLRGVHREREGERKTKSGERGVVLKYIVERGEKRGLQKIAKKRTKRQQVRGVNVWNGHMTGDENGGCDGDGGGDG